MTTFRDLLIDFAKEAKEIKTKAQEAQRMQLDDDMQPLTEIEEDMTTELVDEYIGTIKERMIA